MVSMGALSGSIAERSRASIAAGCGRGPHCNGKSTRCARVAAEEPEPGRGGRPPAPRWPAAGAVGDRPRPNARREFADLMGTPTV